VEQAALYRVPLNLTDESQVFFTRAFSGAFHDDRYGIAISGLGQSAYQLPDLTLKGPGFHAPPVEMHRNNTYAPELFDIFAQGGPWFQLEGYPIGHSFSLSKS
jgi:hypothetical protein